MKRDPNVNYSLGLTIQSVARVTIRKVVIAGTFARVLIFASEIATHSDLLNVWNDEPDRIPRPLGVDQRHVWLEVLAVGG